MADYPGATDHNVPPSFMFDSNTHAAIVLHKTGGDATPEAIYRTFLASGKSVHYGVGSITKLALQAALCYNQSSRNIVCFGGGGTPPSRINLLRRLIIDTLPRHTHKGNTSLHQCAHPECRQVIKPHATYCRNHDSPPTYTVSNGLVYLVMAKGVVVTIDEIDKDAIVPFRWYCNQGGYAVREVEIGKIMGKSISEIAYMHRVIMDNIHNRCLSPYEIIDHIDGDKLNNRRSNLRVTTTLQNRLNSKKRSDATSSQYKGVQWRKDEGKWHARITVNKRLISLGYFKDEKDAALTYNEAAKKYFGEFANLNQLELEDS